MNTVSSYMIVVTIVTRDGTGIIFSEETRLKNEVAARLKNLTDGLGEPVEVACGTAT